MADIKINGTNLIEGDTILNFSDTTPSAPAGSVNVNWGYTESSSGHEASASVPADELGGVLVAEEQFVSDLKSAIIEDGLDHSTLENLTWTTCGHISGSVEPSFATFDDEGVATLTKHSEVDHSVLGNLRWVECGHYSDEDEAMVAGFNSEGIAVEISIAALADQVVVELKHDDLNHLEWPESGHFGDNGSIAAFANSDGAAECLTPAQVAGLISHADLDGLEWENSGHFGAGGKLAGFQVSTGEPIYVDPQDLDITVDLETQVAGVLPVANGGRLVPPQPTFAVKAIEWMEPVQVPNGTTAPGGNRLYFTLHFEEVGHVYDAITAHVAGTAQSGSNIITALYSVGSNGNPNELLWNSATTSSATTGLKVMTFAAGTWASAGAGYKNGSNELLLTPGMAVWKVIFPSSASSFRYLNMPRSLGSSGDGATEAYNGFSEVSTFPTLPATATPVSRNGSMMVLPLRWTS